MKNDNSSPFSANTYDKEIINTIPFYREFYNQTFDVIEQCNFSKLNWLDLGCGTGNLEQLAFKKFNSPNFVMVDPSENMLEIAKEKFKDRKIQYICGDSASICFDSCFEVVTAIQSHHYMDRDSRKTATEKIYKALNENGIYITFENVVPKDEIVKSFELLRWRKFLQNHGKSEEQAKAHNLRCGKNYFPITTDEHIELFKNAGFRHIQIFWYSYMQMGIYGIKETLNKSFVHIA